MRQSIRTKMILWIALPTLLIYLLVAATALAFLRRVEEQTARARMAQQAANYARQFDLLLREAAIVASTSAQLLEIEPRPSEPHLFAMLEANVRNNRSVYGSACAFEPGQYMTDDSLYSPYVYRDGDQFKRMNIDRSVYDWYNDPQWQWFRKPREQGTGTWTDPYFDEGAGNVLMTTYSAPFFSGDTFRGVITVDIQLEPLQKTLGHELADDLDFVVLTKEGRFVYSPDSRRILSQTIFDFASELGRPDLDQVARRALASAAPGVADVDGWDQPERQWVFFAPIASTQWTFMSRLPESIVLQEARRKAMLLTGALALTLALTTLAIWFVSRRITEPIARLKDKVLQIAQGDLNARVDHVAGGDEVAELALSFNRMTDDLQSHVKRVAEQEAAKKQVDHELSLARDIQRGLLPQHPPRIDRYDIAGWSLPAQETGGDYYDWQPLPDGRIVVSIADATGHGIGPALVTAVCRAYARASFPSGESVNKLLARINGLLADDLPSNRFVTFAMAIVDSKTHSLQMLSAGHGPQLYYRAAENRIESFEADGFPLAVVPVVEFDPATTMPMQPGDFLCMITDGFFEWQNREGRIFGLKSLIDAIRAAADQPAAAIIDAAYTAVRNHAAGAAQQDDLTAVIIKRLASS